MQGRTEAEGNQQSESAEQYPESGTLAFNFAIVER